MVIAIHGFLGLPSDWSPFEGAFKKIGLGDTGLVDLWSDLHYLRRQLSETDSDSSDAFSMWGDVFIEGTKKVMRARGGGKPVLLGYSLGGRLAMGALLKAPELFSKAILVSANPGLKTQAERAARLASDQAWARRFRVEPWDELIEAWGAQAVFSGDRRERNEEYYNRELLAMALEHWSLASQPDYREGLRNLELPVLFVTGEKDEKFTRLIEDLELRRPLQRHEVISGAGHRVPWEQPEGFLEALKSFLSEA